MSVPAIIPPNEPQRMAAVKRYEILVSPADGSFDRVTAIAARRFNVPISIISIVDNDRIWFKSHHGLDVPQIGRDAGLCASAILKNEAYILPDAAKDIRSLANPLVAGDFGLRFYAGVPLTTLTATILERSASSTSSRDRSQRSRSRTSRTSRPW